MKKIIFGLILALLLAGVTVEAEPLRVDWSPSSGVVDGYRVYYGSNLQKVLDRETSFIQVSADKTFTCIYIDPIEDKHRKIFVGVTAFNTVGESDVSEFISCLLRGVTQDNVNFHIFIVLEDARIETSGLQIRKKRNICPCSPNAILEYPDMKQINDFGSYSVYEFKLLVQFLEDIFF
jgi:hypothetical protein